MTSRVDTIDLDRFDVIRRLGLGGGGEVYEVLDKRVGRRVALKTVRCTTPEQVAAIKSEFRAIRELRHPNLVSIGELFQQGDRWSFTMELVEGKDLATWFGVHRGASGSGRHATPDRMIVELRGVLTELADAIRALHAIGKHHLDIKPSNVLVTEERRVVLIDYGLVGSGGVQDDGTMIGTLAYVAPERLSRQRVTDATDWYSFGVLVYQLLAGELPYGGEAATLQHLAKLRGPPSRAPLDWAPPDLVELVLELLDADPQRRPDADQIIDRLGARPRQRTPHSSNSMPFAAIAVPEATAALETAFLRAPTASTAVVIDGDAGTGKTATLDRFTADAAERGALVLRTAAPAYELTAFRGLDGLVDALAGMLRALTTAEQLELLPPTIGALARVFPELERVPPVQSMHATELLGSIDVVHDNAARALAGLLGALAHRQTVVIAIDDMHRWDGDALHLFERTALRLPDKAIVIVATTRGNEGCGRDIPRILADGGLELELVQLEATPADERARVLRALERISPTARRLLDALAASAVPLVKELAIQIARVPPAESEACFRELSRSGLIGASGSIDDDARPIVLDRMVPAMIDDWRRRIAPALEAAGAELALVARAYCMAGDRVRTAAAARAAAAECKARGALELAAELLRMVIDAGEDTVVARLDWIAAAREAGHARDAAAELVTLAARDPANAIEHRRVAGLLYLQTGEIEKGLALLRETDGIALPRSQGRTLLALGWSRLVRGGRLQLAEPGDPALRARVDVLWAVSGALGMVDSMRGALVQTQCLALALKSGDPGRAASAIASEAAFRAALLPDRRGVEALFERAVALANRADEPHPHAWIGACRGLVALLYGDWAAVVREGNAADEQLAQIAGTHWERAALSHALIASHFYLGDLGQLAQRSRRQLATTRRLGDRFGETVARLAGITPMIARGDLDNAEKQLEESVRGWPQIQHVQGSFIAVQQANLLIARGKGIAALAIVDPAIRTLRRQLLMQVPLVRIPMRDVAARAAIAAGDPVRARKEIARLDREPLPYARAIARLHEGGVAALVGDLGEAVAARLDAAKQFEACGMPMHAAMARTRAGGDPDWIPAGLIGRWDDFAAIFAP